MCVFNSKTTLPFTEKNLTKKKITLLLWYPSYKIIATVFTNVAWISSFCDIRWIKIFGRIFLSKWDIRNFSFKNIWVGYYIFKFFYSTRISIYRYSVVIYQLDIGSRYQTTWILNKFIKCLKKNPIV